jgi:hypothetical protein
VCEQPMDGVDPHRPVPITKRIRRVSIFSRSRREPADA